MVWYSTSTLRLSKLLRLVGSKDVLFHTKFSVPLLVLICMVLSVVLNCVNVPVTSITLLFGICELHDTLVARRGRPGPARCALISK